MMYFLSMKTYDVANNEFPLVSHESHDLATLIEEAETLTAILCQHPDWHAKTPNSQIVYDNKMESSTMSIAIAKIVVRAIEDFEWYFTDKYGRKVVCFITNNV